MSVLWNKLLISGRQNSAKQLAGLIFERNLGGKSFPVSSSLRFSLVHNQHQSRNNTFNSSLSWWRKSPCFEARRHFFIMPPVTQKAEGTAAKIDDLIKNNPVMIFSKTFCPFCKKVKSLFEDLSIPVQILELDIIDAEEAAAYQSFLKEKTGMGTVPNVFINGKHIGGCDDTFAAHQKYGLLSLLKGEQMDTTTNDVHSYDYDLIVIGGGSGGLAASKEAAKLGKKVAVCDFVKPTPLGTQWGLGGTCVNVGCIPKKLMHQSALLGQAISDASSFGWKLPEDRNHDWPTMVEAIQNYIMSLNWGYRVALKDAKVTYLNEFAEFIDDHTISTQNKKGKTQKLTSKDFIVAVGGRPRYPEIPGAKEFCITSDDLFSLPTNPGKTLCIGASYIALECAGFLAGLGIDTSVMVRSIFLRGFDQQIAEMAAEHMESHGVKFFRGWVPISIIKLEDSVPPRLLVTAKETDGEGILEVEVNTVVLAIGRDPCTKELQLGNAGVKLNSKTGKIYTNESDQSSVKNIYAVGDVAEGRPELTPVAIQAGVLLAKRLYGNSTVLTDYVNVPTTVFTPLEYGCIGLSEEAAIAKHGPENIEVYHTNFNPLESAVPKRDENKSYAKLVCLKTEKERVIGFHYLGPNAGEVTQGFGLGIRLGATKNDFDSLIGIHPTTAETFTTMEITKSSGKSALKTGC